MCYDARVDNGIRRYNFWNGNPKGTKEDPEYCIEEVAEGGRSCLFRQCCRKRGYGPNGLYCKQHAKKHEKSKQ